MRLDPRTRRMQKNVNNKISRLRREVGVEVKGTKYDPRKSADEVASMTARERSRYRNDLAAFLDRQIQFVPNSEGKPIEAAEWKRYKSAEEKRNEVVKEKNSAVGDLLDPHGRPLREREDVLIPRNVAMANPASDKPKEIHRDPENIRDVSYLRKLTEDAMKWVSGEKDIERREGRISSINKMLDQLGSDDFSKAMKGLSDEQIEILWDHTTFAADVSLAYELSKMQFENEESPTAKGWRKAESDSMREALQYVEWAKGIKFTGEGVPYQERSKRRKRR